MSKFSQIFHSNGGIEIRQAVRALVAVALLTSIATEAHAYIGPGAGISAIGSLLALLGAVFLAIVGFLWYPIKRLLKRKKPATQAEAEPEVEQT